MRILFCCQFYAPSIGGVQEVMRQLAERLAARGHDLTVATTKLVNRNFQELNGVKVREFEVSGNQVTGLRGSVVEYARFVTSGSWDVVMINAAQQWTFDALWPVLDKIEARTVLIPCGFSGLYEPSYADYFDQLPAVLRKIDYLIFNASDYRDMAFVKKHGIHKFSVIPNGASEEEFAVDPDPLFRQQHNISDGDLLLLTVGSFMREKGHVDVADAFREADFEGRPATLILNGNERQHSENRSSFRVMRDKVGAYSQAIGDVYDAHGVLAASAHVLHGFGNKLGLHRGRYAAAPATFSDEVRAVIDKVHNQGSKKRVLLLDLSRSELVQAYMNADLFVFASHVECSPLVLFEAVAAGTPFISVPSGNAEEIARWTGGGVICPAILDERGYTVPDSKLLARYLTDLVRDRGRLRQMGATGRAAWRERFTWNLISDQYEQVFLGVSSATCKAESSNAVREVEST